MAHRTESSILLIPPTQEMSPGQYTSALERLSRLQALTAALASAMTSAQIGKVIVEEGLPSLNAEIGVVALVTPDGKSLNNIQFEGVSQETQDAWATYPLDSPVPVAEAALRGVPIIVSTRAERNARYPVLAAVHGPEHGGAVVAYPLLSGTTVIGSLGFCFADDRVFDEVERSYLQTVAQQCATAVVRVQHYDARIASEERLLKTQNILSLAMRSGRMGSWSRDLVQETVWWSPELEEIFGVPSGGFAGTEAGFFALVHPDDQKTVAAAVESAIAERRDYAVEFRFRHSSGEWRWMEGRGRAEYDDTGAPRTLNGVGIDITDRKHAEEALREADRRKDEFIAMLAHELRNPLGPIRNGVHILRQLAPGDERIALVRGTIERQTAHMSRIVDDLLDVSRITRGKLLLKKEVLDLGVVVRETAEDYRQDAEKAGIRFDVSISEGIYVHGDRTRLAQCVGNLLHNAIKFSPTDSAVTIELSKEETAAVIRITDAGIGIEAKVLAILFQPFVQAQQELDRSRGGLGLGLALVKGLVDLHAGNVTARSDGPGKGAQFIITLPTTAPSHVSTSAPNKLAGQGQRVLIIEDNEDSAATLALMLEIEGHELRIASSGRAAFEILADWRPDVILCDIGLPEMDGYAVCRELKSRLELRSTKFYALTGYGQEDDVRRAVEAGFDFHLTKPVDPERLMALVQRPASKLQSFSPVKDRAAN